MGRRLGAPILGAALLLSGALAALAVGLDPAGTVLLLAVAGTSRALLDVAGRSLLQRSVPAHCLGRVFGLLGRTFHGRARDRRGAGAGAGARRRQPARAARRTAAILPLAAVAGGRALFALDAREPVPVVQIALLRSIASYAELPAAALERLASALVPVEVPAGTVLIRPGEHGDAYYAIAAGQFDVFQDGRFLRRCGRGEGVGEIALLRAVPRTATVTARTDATVYQLAREPFLTAVLGHAATQRQAHSIAGTRLAADAAHGNDSPVTGVPDPG